MELAICLAGDLKGWRDGVGVAGGFLVGVQGGEEVTVVGRERRQGIGRGHHGGRVLALGAAKVRINTGWPGRRLITSFC